ncbi:flavodoxin family protein [Phytoactinopolyspora alkaliphila]|uniref:FMN dependent NADH:quinone oxidoreductase n=1 Tax=Phytoactinopolyspora alkaliphila TaxID=1783498 RepID=A0A6N9YIX2_9ACTN|nr:NAD(P)H-dependent oxidoreductase [Phytoactinopolyspora alkaliphila]NED94885.1 flavodoxin family protein [Phytoactinopolyspora alkaliphila]
MTTLLHVSASPRAQASESLALAGVFLDTYREIHPEHTIEHWDLWDGSLPAFGPAATAAKMAVFGGQEFDEDQAAAWRTVKSAFQRFNSADRYLFSVPMWNHGIPYVLKQLIDVVSQPGLAFSFDPDTGYTGLLEGKKAAVIYTGAVYGEGRGAAFGSDFQAPYVRTWLRWAGINEIETVEFRPNLVTADAGSGRRSAEADTRELAKRF